MASRKSLGTSKTSAAVGKNLRREYEVGDDCLQSSGAIAEKSACSMSANLAVGIFRNNRGVAADSGSFLPNTRSGMIKAIEGSLSRISHQSLSICSPKSKAPILAGADQANWGPNPTYPTFTLRTNPVQESSLDGQGVGSLHMGKTKTAAQL